MAFTSKVLIYLLCAVFTFAASGAEGKVYLDVFGKSFKRITIAAPPFKSEKLSNIPSSMGELLAKDLDLSGFFIVTPPSLMDRELTEEGIEKQEIKFSNWRSLGIEILCKGRVIEGNGDVTLEAYLYDTIDGSLILAKRYKTRREEWRRLIHRLSDDIMLAITGEKGIMSSRILFVSGATNRKDIYMVDIDGFNQRKLTDFRSITLSPSVSPNNKYLAYTSYREGKPNLYIVDMERGKEVYVDREEGMKTGTSWYGGNLFAYSHTSGKSSTIYSYDVEKKTKSVIHRSDGIATSPSFSPDGTKMVFVSDMHGSPQIFLKDLPSGTIKRLTFSGTYNTSPAFSPKGDLIAFVSKFEGALEICIMNSDGSNQRVLTNGGINDSPQFSPCGRYILYSSNRGGNRYNIHLMLFNGENRKMLKYTDADETQPKFVQ
ncbi:MAG: Tol-Pal system beta propeller repeat protein TolB [Syntrophorhabdaceae bacterium]|nr:Tol-Pal system beta propeller repeat protein TolB [Syntrophorhabdaceae bacterium]